VELHGGYGKIVSKETIWSFTCTECKNWWSYATNGSWYPRKNMFCPHCGCIQSAEKLQGENINGSNRKEVVTYSSKNAVRGSSINATGTWGRFELVLLAGGSVKERIYCSMKRAENLAQQWVMDEEYEGEPV
jgi:hypothetical protein